MVRIMVNLQCDFKKLDFDTVQIVFSANEKSKCLVFACTKKINLLIVLF